MIFTKETFRSQKTREMTVITNHIVYLPRPFLPFKPRLQDWKRVFWKKKTDTLSRGNHSLAVWENCQWFGGWFCGFRIRKHTTTEKKLLAYLLDACCRLPLRIATDSREWACKARKRLSVVYSCRAIRIRPAPFFCLLNCQSTNELTILQVQKSLGVHFPFPVSQEF